MERVDVAIVGGGIVGLASARAIAARFPGASIVVLEKEPAVARHQSGRNSGVLHTGIYYRPGSMKAELCRRGRAEMRAYCSERGIPLRVDGKVIVATAEDELERLEALAKRAEENGVECEHITPADLKRIEPHATGIEALRVPGAGVVDYAEVCRVLAEELDVRTGRYVQRFEASADAVRIHTTNGALDAARVVNCAGLHSDRIAKLAGLEFDLRIVPFRGEYHQLTPAARDLCRTSIYPVPDPAFPFLGVHLTRGIEGTVECGPNAVPALAREGYRWRDVRLRDLWDSYAWSGALRLMSRNARFGIGEIHRSISKRAFLKALQRLVPELRAEHLRPGPAGVRAQAVGRNGEPLDDFRIDVEGPFVHVLNAPSPAATSSLAIGEAIAERVSL